MSKRVIVPVSYKGVTVYLSPSQFREIMRREEKFLSRAISSAKSKNIESVNKKSS